MRQALFCNYWTSSKSIVLANRGKKIDSWEVGGVVDLVVLWTGCVTELSVVSWLFATIGQAAVVTLGASELSIVVRV